MKYRPAGAFSSWILFLWRFLNPSQFHKRPGHGATELTSLPMGGCQPRDIDVKKTACSWSKQACWCIPSSREGTRDKSYARPQDQNQTREVGLWLEVDGEQTNIWLETGSWETEDWEERRKQLPVSLLATSSSGVCGGTGRSHWPKESIEGKERGDRDLLYLEIQQEPLCFWRENSFGKELEKR